MICCDDQQRNMYKRWNLETFEKYSILFKVKEGKNLNHRNTFSISRIKI